MTGASGAIGGAIARAFHGAGATVVLAGTRRPALEALAGDLGERVAVVTGNLADRAETDALMKAAEETAPVDILVNNAGVTADGLALRMKDEDWDRVIEIDLTAAFRLTRLAVKGMMRRRYGRVISIGSVVAAIGNAGQANYCAAKAGLEGMSRSLARELAPRGITVNVIAPGFIESAMTDALADEQKAAILSQVPAGSLGTGADVAAAALFLASGEARYVTGQTIGVNGGMAMG